MSFWPDSASFKIIVYKTISCKNYFLFMYLGDVKRKQRAKRNLLWRAMLNSKAILNIRNKSSGLRVDVKKNLVQVLFRAMRLVLDNSSDLFLQNQCSNVVPQLFDNLCQPGCPFNLLNLFPNKWNASSGSQARTQLLRCICTFLVKSNYV